MSEAETQAMGAIVERYRVNWRGYLHDFRFWIVAFLIACMADAASTIYFMQELGPQAELHPGVRYLSMLLGPVAGPIFGKLAQVGAALFVTVYLRKWAKLIFSVAIMMYTWAAWYNVWGVEIYTSLFHQILGYCLA